MPVVLLGACFIFWVDFLIKNYLHANFAFQSIPVIKNIFHITVVFNRGAAFGILQGQTFLLALIGVIFILVFFILLRREKNKDLFFLLACSLILGGALSNLYDRIFFGCVIDYLDFRIWPVFNLSDSAITVGAAMLIFHSLRSKKYEEKNSSP